MILAYSRKSRYAPQETMTNRLAILERLAAPIGPLSEIIEEIGDSTDDNRPGFQRLLSLARSGVVTHIVCTERSRLHRGTAGDWEALEDLFTQQRIVLVTGEGLVDYGDLGRSPLTQRIIDAVNAEERRRFGERLRNANRERLAKNEPRGGKSPYGYARDRSAKGCYRTTDEYPILCEILRRAMTETLRGLARCLNERCIPTPGQVKSLSNAGRFWTEAQVRQIVKNPFYAGYHVQRHACYGGRVVRLESFRLADEEGDWIHPLTLEEHYRLRARIEGGRTESAWSEALLAGILWCPNGARMSNVGDAYGCRCRQNGEPHAGSRVGRARIELYIRQSIDALLLALPADWLETPLESEGDSSSVAVQWEEARRRMARKRDAAAGMVASAAEQRELYGQDIFEAALSKVCEEFEAAKREVERLEKLLGAPSREDRSRAAELRRGVPWQDYGPSEQRVIVRYMIDAVHMPPIKPGRKYFNGARIEWNRFWLPLPAAKWPKWPKRGAHS